MLKRQLLQQERNALSASLVPNWLEQQVPSPPPAPPPPSLKVIRISVVDLLSELMSPDSLFWEYKGMLTLNPVCSELSPLVAAKAYLRQRDDGALAASRSLESRYYPVNYWSQSSLCLIQPVLSRLGSSR
jgi:hypothetical protein